MTGRTNAPSVKHDVARPAIAKAGKNSDAASDDDRGKKPQGLGRPLCEDGVVGGCSPEMVVGDG